MNKRNLIINSTLLFVIATLWQQTLHEFAHFVGAILYHSKDIMLYHNYVRHDTSELTMNSRLVIAAAGPLFSLLIGIVFHIICANYRKRNLRFLFCLFMSTFGYINFGGYLLVAPFFTGGDTGFIFNQLAFPLWLTITFAVFGAVFLFYAMKMLSRFFVEMGTEQMMTQTAERRELIDALVKYPLYFGIVLTALFNLPVVTPLSLLYPVFSPFTLFWGFGFLLVTPYPTQRANKEMDKLSVISPILLAAFALTIVCNRLFVMGWHW